MLLVNLEHDIAFAKVMGALALLRPNEVGGDPDLPGGSTVLEIEGVGNREIGTDFLLNLLNNEIVRNRLNG